MGNYTGANTSRPRTKLDDASVLAASSHQQFHNSLTKGRTTAKSGFDSRQGRKNFSFLHRVHTGSAVHPASCPINKWGYSGRSVKLNIYLDRDKRLEKRGIRTPSERRLIKEMEKRETKWVKQNKTKQEETEE
jgi:hypothetical protein